MGFAEVLTLILLVLKLLGKIQISWLVVFAPMLAIYALLAVGFVAAISLKIFLGRK